MAFPKPLRALAVLSLILFIFMIFQLFRTPPTIHKPGKGEDAVPDMKDDPMADRKLLQLCKISFEL